MSTLASIRPRTWYKLLGGAYAFVETRALPASRELALPERVFAWVYQITPGKVHKSQATLDAATMASAELTDPRYVPERVMKKHNDSASWGLPASMQPRKLNPLARAPKGAAKKNPRGGKITFGKMEGPSDQRECDIFVNGECVGAITSNKQINYRPSKHLDFAVVEVVIFAQDEEASFGAPKYNATTALSAAKAWAKAKLAPKKNPSLALHVPARTLRAASSYGYASIGRELGSELVRDLAYWSAGAGATAKLYPVLKAAGQPRKLPVDRVVPEGAYLAVEHVYEGFIQPHVIASALPYVRREVDHYFNLGGY